MLETMDLSILLNSLAADALVEAMDVMAFVIADLAETSAPAPANAVVVRMPFRGSSNGVVEIVTAPELGALLACNVLGKTSDEIISAEAAQDALKELLNMTCGLLFNKLSPTSDGYEISLPQLHDFDADRDWNRFVGRAGASVLVADGIVIAIHVKLEDAG